MPYPWHGSGRDIVRRRLSYALLVSLSRRQDESLRSDMGCIDGPYHIIGPHVVAKPKMKKAAITISAVPAD